MVISFKDQLLELRLSELGKETAISPSLIARRDLARWYWLLDDHEPIRLEHNEFMCVCSIVKSTQLFEEPSRIKKMAFLVEDCIRGATTSTGEYSQVERFGIDVDSLCAKLRQASTLQLAGLVLRCESYPSADLWRRREMELNIVDTLIDGMEAALAAEYLEQIEKFLDANDVTKWIIASDYSMGRPEFTHDAMAFALIPYTDAMFPPTELNKRLPVDFKDCGKVIDPSYISYLREAPVFNFVFLLDRSQKIFATTEMAEQAVRNTLEMMKAWPNASEPQNIDGINKVQLCLNESKKKSFLRKVNELTLLALLGAFVGLVATRKSKKLDAVLWAPDRDSMNGVWNGLASVMFQDNLHSILHRRRMPEKYIHAVAIENDIGGKPWIDDYIRLADFLATPAAGLMRQEDVSGKFDKCDQIVREVFTDNPRLVIQRLAFVAADGKLTPDIRRMEFSKKPFPEVSVVD